MIPRRCWKADADANENERLHAEVDGMRDAIERVAS